MVLKLHHLSTFRKCRISPRKTLCYLKGGETSFIWYHFEWLSFLLINGDWKRPGERSEMLNTRPISKDMSICLCLSTITRHMRCFQVEDDAKIELITTKDAINPPKQECIVHKFPVCVCGKVDMSLTKIPQQERIKRNNRNIWVLRISRNPHNPSSPTRERSKGYWL